MIPIAALHRLLLAIVGACGENVDSLTTMAFDWDLDLEDFATLVRVASGEASE